MSINISLDPRIQQALSDILFHKPGVYTLSDGQYGSTGKGVIAGLLADIFQDKVDAVLTNAGPNSGHTFYYNELKIVLKQLPTFGVVATLVTGRHMPIFLTAGAVINYQILMKEAQAYNSNVYVHPHAAYVTTVDKLGDRKNVRAMASTGQGVGPAIIDKIERKRQNVFDSAGHNAHIPGSVLARPWANWRGKTMFMEISQGFSLGINSGFYPYVTSRECSVSQALSDAGLPPTAYKGGVLSVRTYPIRVGDTENSSGPCYNDQREISWESLDVEPETTTVTNRIRRIFTFSKQQFVDAVSANVPDVVFVNFMNYLKTGHKMFIKKNIVEPYVQVMGKKPIVLLGHGPKSSDVKLYTGD